MIDCVCSVDTRKRTVCVALNTEDYIRQIRDHKCGTSACPFYKETVEERPMRRFYHNDDYFEQTDIDKQRVCCNCRHRDTSTDKCDMDGHHVGYIDCFTQWCVHWSETGKKRRAKRR